jgi:hypothetical protein
MGPHCSSAETQVCHRSYIIAARCLPPLSTMFQLDIVAVSFIGGGHRSTGRKPTNADVNIHASIAKYGIDIQIVRPEMTKFKMFREKSFYFVIKP